MSPRRSVRLEPREQEAARFHRESDRRRLRSMAGALLCTGFLVALILGMVAVRVQQVRLSYRLDTLRVTKVELDEANRRLRVELATLKSLARIDGKARAELGMLPPGRNQVRLAREFVPGGSGLSAAAPRTALVERAAVRDGGIR